MCVFLKYVILIILTSNAYKLTDHYNNDNKLINIYPCLTGIPIKLWETVNDAVSAVNDLNYFNIILHQAPSKDTENTLCTTTGRSATHFYMETYPTTMNININDNLLFNNNTLYNVVLHEMGHMMGLGHTYTSGIMNYSIQSMVFDIDGESHTRYIEDCIKLWLSYDDIRGIARSYWSVKKKYCSKSALSRDEYLYCMNSPWYS
jgi:hypothetical protein